ncbi:hypothetical protein [Metapseudomonas resinovorans]|uniref:Uncharacterized protein n=1 Tax=Metapseudomonas resinovorans NBRC 106553 TaxID=1245471 RepID=S6AWN7_METRE|nr:hypothetical protein [Pseudomonas resinovorans]BAN50798.1 hypothetical protein PCA10_50660 [Pseudomonas resinovorans NBRC 106553]
MLNINLEPTQRNAGRIGRATFAPRGDQTSVSMLVSGVPPSVTRPVRLLAFIYPGTCAEPGGAPAYELNRTATTFRNFDGDVWRLSRNAPVALSKLKAGEYSLVLRTTPANGGFDIFCGDIR